MTEIVGKRVHVATENTRAVQERLRVHERLAALSCLSRGVVRWLANADPDLLSDPESPG